LGNGSISNQNTPTIVSGINNATSITASKHHTCALLSDDTVKCWGSAGSGGAGILGSASTTETQNGVPISSTPILIIW